MNLDGTYLKEVTTKDNNAIACRIDSVSEEALIYINPNATTNEILKALLIFHTEYSKLRLDNGDTKEEI